jgi:hypothetical protein
LPGNVAPDRTSTDLRTINHLDLKYLKIREAVSWNDVCNTILFRNWCELRQDTVMSIQAVIFDLDGTLVDANEAHIDAWWEAFHVDAHVFQ